MHFFSDQVLNGSLEGKDIHDKMLEKLFLVKGWSGQAGNYFPAFYFLLDDIINNTKAKQ